MTHPCLKCKQILTQDSEAVLGGAVCPIFQCDQCTTLWHFGGEQFEVALTFAIAPDGTIVDPRDPTKPMVFN